MGHPAKRSTGHRRGALTGAPPLRPHQQGKLLLAVASSERLLPPKHGRLASSVPHSSTSASRVSASTTRARGLVSWLLEYLMAVCCERFMIVRLRFRGRLFRELLVCCSRLLSLLGCLHNEEPENRFANVSRISGVEEAHLPMVRLSNVKR